MTNARSLGNKMDKLVLAIDVGRTTKDCSLVVVTETWLYAGIPDEAIMLAGCTAHWADRNNNSSKSRGGGDCIYSYNRWCTNATVTERHCSADLEFIALRCRPFYLLCEFTVVFVIAVYIPPSADTNTALSILLKTIEKLQSVHPDGIFIVAGDFNHVNMRTVLPNFYQHVTCPTREGKTLDHVHSNVRGA